MRRISRFITVYALFIIQCICTGCAKEETTLLSDEIQESFTIMEIDFKNLEALSEGIYFYEGKIQGKLVTR